MVPPVTVYLDSSDYSTLSDPRHRTGNLDQVRETLQELAKSNLVRFVFSGAHLSEMAPLDAKYTPAATARADLLVELCGRNALVSFDRLIASELAHLANPDMPPVQALSSDATWFPEIKDIVSPVKWADTAREINQMVKEKGLNRQQRRVLKLKLFKANTPTPIMQEWLANRDPAAALNDIISLYPMRPQDAKVISRYVLGQATAKEAEDAFLESLRDPRWMMRWFAAHHDVLTPVTEWLRGPSRRMATQMKEIAAQVKELRRAESRISPEIRPNLLTNSGWIAEQDGLLLNVANHLATKFHPGLIPCGNVELVDRYCPGLSTAFRSLHSSVGESIGSNPRMPLDSDFIDAIHSMYAPYVTFFRADRFMAPHIRKQVARYGTQVVSRLDELPDQIHDLLCHQQ
jgi:hypothetical protein